MKRTPFKRTAVKLERKTKLESRSKLVTKTRLARTRMKVKRRRRKPGDDPKYLRFIRKQPCVVGGKKCRRSHAHHAIEMGGQQERGMGLKAPDSETLPICDRHHREFHTRRGFCFGWSNEQRRVFQQDEIDRCKAIYAGIQELGVAQEPLREAV